MRAPTEHPAPLGATSPPAGSETSPDVPEVQRRLLDALKSGAAFGVPADTRSSAGVVPDPSSPGPDGLTRREVEVVRHIAAGHSNADIAGALFVSEATVKTHINHIFAKTGVRDRAQLVTYAFRRGIATATAP